MPRAPGAETLIALAGPAVNFAIVGTLYLLGAMGLNGLLADSAAREFLGDLMYINLVLGLFNLIPAFPMDGGRVLRSVLSGWLGRARATTIAATVGRVCAVAFGMIGMLTLSLTGNPFPLALAVFIYTAARAEEMQVLHEERRRQSASDAQGVWVAPPGYRWVHQGDGLWRLAPIIVVVPDREPGYSPWR
jgi:Zn-dependent protease